MTGLLHYAATKIDSDQVNIPKVNLNQAQVESIFGGALAIAGVVAVVFIILGGIKYSTSQGDSSAVSQAKEMIIYSLVGIVIIMLSFAILQLVAGRVAGG